MDIRVAQIVQRTAAEGPGLRFALWVQGCPIRCPGCCNPEMLSKGGGLIYDTGQMAESALSDRDVIEGVSIIGGEPFAQAAACADFAERVRAGGLSVVTFTGYPYETLKTQEGSRRLLEATDLLIDGQFDRRRPEKTRRWVGSSNQRLLFLTNRYVATDPRFYEGNTIEIRYKDGAVSVNGWPVFEVGK